MHLANGSTSFGGQKFGAVRQFHLVQSAREESSGSLRRHQPLECLQLAARCQSMSISDFEGQGPQEHDQLFRSEKIETVAEISCHLKTFKTRTVAIICEVRAAAPSSAKLHGELAGV